MSQSHSPPRAQNRGDPRQTHAAVWPLLPFQVNRTLDAGERAMVETHLAECLTCRAELELLRQVERGVRDEAVADAATERAWQLLAAELVADRAGQAARRRAPGSLSWLAGRWGAGLTSLADAFGATPRPARLVMAVQALLLAVAVGWVAAPAAPGTPLQYETLSAGRAPADARADEQSAPLLRVRFADAATELRLRLLLHEAGLVIVAGPSAAGLYVLAPGAPAIDQAAALALLRAAPEVRLVQPVGGESGGAPAQ